MTTTTNNRKPADTTMMGVVHDALRRDLRRVDATLNAESAVGPERRRALSAHVEWMMEFLHRHHHGEDKGLWPLLRGRTAEGDALLDRMEADHAGIAPAIEDVLKAARRFATDPADRARTDLQASLRAFSEVLLPHLRREEDDAMPLVAATLTEAEWNGWDQKYNVKGKSLSQLGREGQWLMDSLDAARYRVLVHLVPPPARLLIIKGFARSYRKACALRWGLDVPVGPLASRAGERPGLATPHDGPVAAGRPDNNISRLRVRRARPAPKLSDASHSDSQRKETHGADHRTERH